MPCLIGEDIAVTTKEILYYQRFYKNTKLNFSKQPSLVDIQLISKGEWILSAKMDYVVYGLHLADTQVFPIQPVSLAYIAAQVRCLTHAENVSWGTTFQLKLD